MNALFDGFLVAVPLGSQKGLWEILDTWFKKKGLQQQLCPTPCCLRFLALAPEKTPTAARRPPGGPLPHPHASPS